jgi:uncharacterized protein YbjT (DUF2867 family)
MITVMGATGHTGKKITESLLNAGEEVRALGRSESKLAELESAGAEVLAGDTNDAAFLTKAFRGADAVYTLLPTDRRASDYRAEQDRQGETIVTAIRESGVRYVVALSSVGADLSEGNGVIAGLHAQQERLKQINVPRNNTLAAVDLACPEGASLWARCLTEWTAWNDVRTAAALKAAALLIVAISRG